MSLERGKPNLCKFNDGKRQKVEKGSLTKTRARRMMRETVLKITGKKRLPAGVSEIMEQYLASTSFYSEKSLKEEVSRLLKKTEKIEQVKEEKEKEPEEKPGKVTMIREIEDWEEPFLLSEGLNSIRKHDEAHFLKEFEKGMPLSAVRSLLVELKKEFSAAKNDSERASIKGKYLGLLDAEHQRRTELAKRKTPVEDRLRALVFKYKSRQLDLYPDSHDTRETISQAKDLIRNLEKIDDTDPDIKTYIEIFNLRKYQGKLFTTHEYYAEMLKDIRI